MKAKFLAFSLAAIYALFLVGCKEEITSDYKAKRLGLICINGYVFKESYKGRTTILEPLHIECSNGKVIVD